MSITSLSVSTTVNSLNATLSGFTSTAVIATNKTYKITGNGLPSSGAVFDTTGLTIPTSGTLSISFNVDSVTQSSITTASGTATIDEITSPLWKTSNLNKFNFYAYGTTNVINFSLTQSAFNKNLFNLSGVELDQSQYSSSVPGTNGAVQQFAFTSDYLRAEKYAPSITGFQIFAEVNHSLTPELTYYLSKKDSFGNWVALASGKQTIKKLPSKIIKNQWITIKTSFIDFDTNWIEQDFKLQVFGNSGITKIYY